MKLPKFSDAVVMGSGLIRFDPSIYLSVDDWGCLIGMGAAAIGKTDCLIKDMDFYFPEYPWLYQLFETKELGLSFMSHPFPAYMIIGQMARQIKHGTYTFEQAIAWIRSVEPQAEPWEHAGESETHPSADALAERSENAQ